MAQTRKRLLQTALGFYQDLIEQRRGDAEAQADLAADEQKVKGILRELELLRRDMRTMLLRTPVVIRELELDKKQKDRIDELMRQWDEDWKELRAELDGLDEEGRRHRLVVVAEKREALLNQVLDAEQDRRLGQLLIQWQGLSAFKEPEVVAALELTNDQRAAIRKIEREFFSRRPEEDRGPPDGAGPRRDRGRHDGRPERRPPREPGGPKPHDDRQAMTKVMGVLNQDQILRWKELTGEPVDGLHKPPFEGPPPGPAGDERPRDGRRHEEHSRDDRRREESAEDRPSPEQLGPEQPRPEQPTDAPDEK
jgi:hypothetical protein